MPRLVLLVCEVHDNNKDIDDILDNFREAVLPSSNYNLTIYRSVPRDVEKFDIYGDEGFIPTVMERTK